MSVRAEDRDGVLPAASTGADHAAADPAPGPRPMALRVVGGLLVAVAAVGLSVMESFLVPLRAGTVPLPLSVLLAVLGNVLLCRLGGRWTESTVGAAVPAVLWLVTVVVLSLPRPEGDLVVPGTLMGLVFLFAGAVAGAYGVASSITRRIRPVPSGLR